MTDGPDRHGRARNLHIAMHGTREHRTLCHAAAGAIPVAILPRRVGGGAARARPACLFFRDGEFVQDNAGVKWLRHPQSVLLALLAGAAVGAGVGILAGPVWAVAGTDCGPVIVLVSASVVDGCTTPVPANLLQAGQHREALAVISRTLPHWRRLARLWPSQFQEALASVLMSKSLALLEAHQQDEARAAAAEGVAIYRALAQARPGKQTARLAAALNNQAYPLMATGHNQEAVQAAEEAVRAVPVTDSDASAEVQVRPGKLTRNPGRGVGARRATQRGPSSHERVSEDLRRRTPCRASMHRTPPRS